MTLDTLISDPAAASTVNYNRTGAQTVFASANYRNLNVSGGGTKTLQGNTTVGGTLTLTSGDYILTATILLLQIPLQLAVLRSVLPI